MRFLARSIWGGLIVAACAVVLWFGVSTYTEARQGNEEGRPKRPTPERIYTVRDALLESKTLAPTMVVYGEIQAGRILEVRAPAAGKIVDLAPGMRDGATVGAGNTLLRIDPSTTRSREADTIAVLADARSQQSEAQQAFLLARADLEAALRQLKVRRAALERQQGLRQRGVASAISLENAQLAASSAEQAVASRRTAYLGANQRIQQAATAVKRAEITLGDARRDIADTRVTVPFTGLLTDVNATLGALVTPNERLARVIDMRSLEAAFRVSDAQYARMLNVAGGLEPLNAEISLRLGERTVSARAVLERVAATVSAEGGRVIYARIQAQDETPMRPGDFVTVSIKEPALQGVAEIPARAANEAGIVFVIGEEGRLSEHQATILRRLPDTLIVRDVPFGSKIVAERRPQLGPGIKVQSAKEAAIREAEDKKKRAARRAARAGGGKPPKAGKKDGRPTETVRPQTSRPTPEGAAPSTKKPEAAS